jgi:SSS family solute:Na+ symporter
MVQANPERFHVYRPPSDPNAPFLGLLVGSVGVFLFYQPTNQVMIQRVLGARTPWDGVMGIIFAGFINILRPLVTCFLGFIVYHWIFEMHKAEPLASRDLAFPFALKNFAPQWGLRGMILAGFLAAVMSATSALANSTATIFALDVYKRLFDPNASDRKQVAVGRITSVVALVIAGLVAPAVGHLGGIFQYFQTGVTFLAVPFVSVILLGILWKRANYAGGLFGCAGGAAIAGGTMAAYLYARAHGYPIHWLYAAFFAQILIVIGMIVVTLATPAPPLAQWEPFVWRWEFLKELSGDTPRPWYKQIKLWFGIYAVTWIAIYAYLW